MAKGDKKTPKPLPPETLRSELIVTTKPGVALDIAALEAKVRSAGGTRARVKPLFGDRETLMHPVLITNTGSVGTVHEAEIAYMNERHPTRDWAFLPVVAETWDGTLNDVRGQHVKKPHVFAAIDDATDGVVAEGNVGGGTGMVCYGFKGGIGTSSRRVGENAGGYTVGVLVQANYGLRGNDTVGARSRI